MIISSHDKDLDGIVRDMKSYISKELKTAIEAHPQESRREWMLWMMKKAGETNSSNKDRQFWQQNNKPIEINGRERFVEALEYTHQNPVVAGFVHEDRDWVYSSARG